jgi:hypothetical protein
MFVLREHRKVAGSTLETHHSDADVEDSNFDDPLIQLEPAQRSGRRLQQARRAQYAQRGCQRILWLCSRQFLTHRILRCLAVFMTFAAGSLFAL